MFLYILLFSIVLKLSEAMNCKEKKMEKSEFFSTTLKEAFFINTDQADFQQVNSIGYDILQFHYSLHYEIEGIQISAILLESFQNYDELQICNLIINVQTYFIQCIIGFTFILEKINLQYSNKTVIITQPNEVCEQIYYDEKQKFTIFCYSVDHLQLISINLDEKTQFYSFYNYTQDHELKHCKPISIQIKPFQYIIGHLNCSDWSIFEVSDNKITLILDQQILKRHYDQVDLTNLINLQICQYSRLQRQLVYALFDTGYITIENFQITQFISLNQEKQIKITQLIFDKLCQVSTFVGYEESLIPFQYYEQQSTISFSKSISPHPLVHYHEQYKIFQHEKMLQVFINQKFIQYYDISGLLIFYRTFNYLYSIDQSLNLIKLFRIRSLPKYIVPQYEYIYQYYLKDFDCCKQENIQCNKIILKDAQLLFQEYNFSSNNYYFIKNNLEVKFYINYNQLMIGIPIYLEVPKQYQNILSINQIKNKFSDICQQNRIYQNSYILLYDSDAKLFVFQDEKFIYFYNCTQQQLFLKEQKQDKSVFIFQNKIIILDKILNLLNIINVSQNQLKYHNLKIHSQIEQAQLFQNFLYINFKEKEPLIIELFSQDFLVQHPGINNKDIVLFYSRDFNFFQIYQFQDYLFLQKNKDFSQIKFLDYQILAMNQALIFIVLHKIEYTIKVFTFNQNEVTFLQNIDLFDFSIYKPLQYLFDNFDFYIVAEKQNKLYLLTYSIMQFRYKIKLIIQIGQPNFYIKDDMIYYYDENNLLVYLNNQKIAVTYHMKEYNKLFEIVDLHLNLFSLLDFKRYNIYNLRLKILIQNQKIYPKSNLSIQLNSKNEIKIQVSNHFSGPIDILSLNDECPFNLSGPFQIREHINSCVQNVTSFCLQKQEFVIYTFWKSKFVFLKIMKDNNKIKLVLLSSERQLCQLRNGDLLQIKNFNGEINQAIIYKYDFISNRFVQNKSINLSLNYNISTYAKVIGNVILLQNQTYFYLLYLHGDFISNIYETQFNIGIVYVENSDEEYLVVINSNKYDIDITHYNFPEGIVSPIHTYNIQKEKLLLLALDQRDYFINPSQIEDIQLNLIDALKIELQIQINCILHYENLKFYVTLILNTLNQTFESNLLKILRNMFLIQRILHIDKSFAVFEDFEYQYIYDLRQEQQFYDPINQIDKINLIIQDYNNTHYILYNSQKEEAFLIEIGYEINIKNKEKSNECILIAENEISKAEIQVIIQQEEINNKYIDYIDIKILSIILICIFIILIIFIFRRQQLKKQNQILFQSISLDQSKIQ